jgi:hypothetical protein
LIRGDPCYLFARLFVVAKIERGHHRTGEEIDDHFGREPLPFHEARARAAHELGGDGDRGYGKHEANGGREPAADRYEAAGLGGFGCERLHRAFPRRARSAAAALGLAGIDRADVDICEGSCRLIDPRQDTVL